jgi:uncharacterized protein YbbC (DUF1343 family)
MSSKRELKVGIDVLEEKNFDILQGKRVGILTNQAAVDKNGNQTWKILKEVLGDNLVAIFAPEHGLHGKFLAGEAFSTSEEGDTPIYAMYGYESKPKKKWLKGIDIVVIDLQDLGLRHYTYCSSMIYMLAACAENRIKVIVLDRPNPLSGKYIGGPSMDPELCSFCGPIAGMPMYHGMTIGEIANYIKNSGISINASESKCQGEYISGLNISGSTLSTLDLQVVKMDLWKRSMLWTDSGLPWTKTSPRIPDWNSVLDYAMVSILHIISKNPGCGFRTYVDFINNRHFGSIYSRDISCKDMVNMIKNIDKESLQGYSFLIKDDDYIMNRKIQYLSLKIRDIKKTIPALLALTITSIVQKFANWDDCDDEIKVVISKNLGDNEFSSALVEGKEIDVGYFKNKWDRLAKKFIENTKDYYLYE